MKTKGLLTHAAAAAASAALAVGAMNVIEETSTPTPALPQLAEFATAYHAPGDFMTFAPSQNASFGSYKAYTRADGTERMVAFFDRSIMELRERPTHVMEVVVDSTHRDLWFARYPRTERILARLGDVVHLSRIAEDSTYGRLEAVAVCSGDTTMTIERLWDEP